MKIKLQWFTTCVNVNILHHRYQKLSFVSTFVRKNNITYFYTFFWFYLLKILTRPLFQGTSCCYIKKKNSLCAPTSQSKLSQCFLVPSPSSWTSFTFEKVDLSHSLTGPFPTEPEPVPNRSRYLTEHWDFVFPPRKQRLRLLQCGSGPVLSWAPPQELWGQLPARN